MLATCSAFDQRHGGSRQGPQAGPGLQTTATRPVAPRATAPPMCARACVQQDSRGPAPYFAVKILCKLATSSTCGTLVLFYSSQRV